MDTPFAVYITRLVAAAPPPTPEQRATLSALFTPYLRPAVPQPRVRHTTRRRAA